MARGRPCDRRSRLGQPLRGIRRGRSSTPRSRDSISSAGRHRGWKNAASQAFERIYGYVEAGDWDALAELTAENVSVDDRRLAVDAGIRTGRDAAIEDSQATAEVGFTLKMVSVIATRGARLALIRVRVSGRDPEAIANDAWNIVEIDSDGRIAAVVVFDLEDIDAAFTELEARYLAGESAAHAHVWSVIAQECAAFNRHELPAADWVTIDHRQLAVIDAREGQTAMRDIWEVTPNLSMRIEAVHRLSSSGAVSSYMASGTSSEGVDAEWKMILLLTVEGDRINRCEIFDEADRDTALTRFEELQSQASHPHNAASGAAQRFTGVLRRP